MKDPAVLLYIDKWISATMGMEALARAYYLDLILHQYDKGSIPNDIEDMAVICRVKHSEFDKFKQVFKQVLEQKFERNQEGNLEQPFAKEILQKRKVFKEKRSNSGKLSYVIRYARHKLKASEEEIEFIKSEIDLNEIDIKNEQVLKQVLKQIIELYINVNVDVDINKDFNVSFEEFWNLYDKKRGDKNKLRKKWESLKDSDREAIMNYLPKYIQSTPDKQYRKDPQTFLNNRSWEDEIISKEERSKEPVPLYMRTKPR